MKMTEHDVQALREAIAPFDTERARQRYLAGDYPRATAVKDVDKRYRFDLFYAARGYSVIGDDYTDAHIYTALKAIVPALRK